jgi:putative transposase
MEQLAAFQICTADPMAQCNLTSHFEGFRGPSLSSLWVARKLDAVIVDSGRPATFVSDSGTELTCMAMVIAPCEPTQSASIENFNSRLGMTNKTLFASLTHVRSALAEWRHDYNTTP